MNSVRFRQVGSIRNAEGLVSCDGARLRLEYQFFDPILGVLKSRIKQVDIPLGELARVELAGGWIGGYKILLEARTMEAVRDVPGMSQARIELPIDRADREAARTLVDSLHKPALMYDPSLDA